MVGRANVSFLGAGSAGLAGFFLVTGGSRVDARRSMRTSGTDGSGFCGSGLRDFRFLWVGSGYFVLLAGLRTLHDRRVRATTQASALHAPEDHAPSSS